jgi:superfamily I DNA/RNA helicase
VEVRERIEEITPQRPFQDAVIRSTSGELPLSEPSSTQRAKPELAPPQPFLELSQDNLLSIGVPQDWIADILTATEDQFLDLGAHLPAEASETLLEYVSTGISKIPEPVTVADPYAHPDALRRIRVVENAEELEQALSYPWERWIVFLHPSQRAIVEQTFSGPARVSGSAGTGKTVVAIHRARRLASESPNARVLLTTFSDPLAFSLERKLEILAGGQSEIIPRIVVASFLGIATELYQLSHAHKPVIASDELVRNLLLKAAESQGIKGFTERFLISEWTHCVDAWQIKSAEAYAELPRLGRKSRVGSRQRERLWPIFATVIAELEKRGFMTEAGVFHSLAEHYNGRTDKPFSHVIVDEAQDLGVPQLRFMRAIAPDGPDGLFFAGDLGQRIFQQPFSWAGLGVDVRGRSVTLKVNYRTSHQIRERADRLLPGVQADVDGRQEVRKGTVSVFNGPPPIVKLLDTVDQEIDIVGKFIHDAVNDGIKPEEIGVFVRVRTALPRVRKAVAAAGLEPIEITPRKEGAASAVSIGIMHLAKGLEFKAVAVMACDDGLLPLEERIEAVADEVELDDVYATECQLLYVACTRARDRLLITGIKPGSEFLADLN